MKFNVRPFRRFQWQLSLSYTLVAVGALLVVELALIFGFLALLNADFLPRLLVRSFREQFSANLRVFLDHEPPDLKGLSNFLEAYASPNIGVNAGTNNQVWNAEESEQNLLVLDRQGRLLWSQLIIPGSSLNEVLDPALLPGLARVLPAAMANDPEAGHLFAQQGNMLVLAVPVETQDRQRVLGVIVLQLLMPSITNPNFMMQLLPTILVSVLVFTLCAGLVGSVFGYFTARRLTRRLGQVSSTADAWSRGDFTGFIQDSTGDELGEMSRRLNSMAEQLQNLMGMRQQLAALEERNRIARELHDSVKQQVFAAAMQLGAAHALLSAQDGADESDAARHLTEAEQLTREAQNELNALIHELRPVALEGKGLARALRELTGDWSRQSGVAVQLETPGDLTNTEPRLPLMKEQALYRIAQEALSNVARHGQAHSVRLRYCREANEARLTIRDDGQGFNPSNLEYSQGIGLRSMRERVEGLGGRLEIESAVGKGTQLVVRMPIQDGLNNEAKHDG